MVDGSATDASVLIILQYYHAKDSYMVIVVCMNSMTSRKAIQKMSKLKLEFIFQLYRL